MLTVEEPVAHLVLMHPGEIQGHLTACICKIPFTRVDVDLQILHAGFDDLGGLSDWEGLEIVFLAVSAAGGILAGLIALLELTLRHYDLINVFHILQGVLELMKTYLKQVS